MPMCDAGRTDDDISRFYCRDWTERAVCIYCLSEPSSFNDNQSLSKWVHVPKRACTTFKTNIGGMQVQIV